MPSKLPLISALYVLGAVVMITPVSTALAQGSFAGRWTVTEVVRPDWIEPTSPEPIDPLRVGDSVEFAADAVNAKEPIGCQGADYQQTVVSLDGLFQGGISDKAKAVEVAQRFGLSASNATLRVNCDSGTFEYYQNKGGLVMQFDNVVYRLNKQGAAR